MDIKFISEQNIATYNVHAKLYIFGAGEYAICVKQFLEKYHISIEAFCVDDRFYVQNCFIDGIKVVPLSFLERETDISSYDVFYAVASPKRLADFKGIKWLEEVYMIFDPFELWKHDDKFMQENEKMYNDALSLFADDKSKKIMIDFLYAKQTGDATNDMDNCCSNTYFNHLTEEAFNGNGAYIDCGAFDGDSVQKYLNSCESHGTVYAFEPDANNYKKLVKRFKDDPSVRCLPYGVWDEDKILHFNNTGDQSACINIQGEGDDSVKCVSIDNIVMGTKVSFIKMDVEGAELRALSGARSVITRDMPVMAISAYHKIDDLITLPQYIRSLAASGHSYQLYLRHHGCVATELVLYAIPYKCER